MGYSPKTINNHLAVLRGALNVAREWGIIFKTPRYRELRPREQSVRFLSRIEASTLVTAADETFRTMLIVALNTGLRIGELLALQWCDIHFDTRKMVVRRNLWRNQVGSPKSGKSRKIALNGAVIAALTSQRRGQVP